MPTVSDAARVTTRDGAVWRNCAGCGVLVALPPEVGRCGGCVLADPAGLTAAQLDGLACVACGVTAGVMVPAGVVAGCGQVFACTDCAGAAGWSR